VWECPHREHFVRLFLPGKTVLLVLPLYQLCDAYHQVLGWCGSWPGALPRVQPRRWLQANGKVHVERLQRDGAAALGTEEARAIVERDAPELLALLEELKDSLQELRSRVGPVLAQVPAAAVLITRTIAVQLLSMQPITPVHAQALCCMGTTLNQLFQ
jgi:hypothetical protein